MKDKKIFSALLILFSLFGCTTVRGKPDPRDPFEGYNRSVYKFNDALDRTVLKPVAQGYDTITPDLIKAGIRNFFSNLGELVTITNDALQGKGEQAASDTGRFIINSTFGMLGLFDIATPIGLTKNNEDFGQTLGKWGVGTGPYFVLPFLGPSTVRDALAKPVDWPLRYPAFVDYVPTRNSAYALETIDTRANLLGATNILGEAALDPYVFVRDAYLQRRQGQVYDGNSPKTEDDWEDDSEASNNESGDKATKQKQ